MSAKSPDKLNVDDFLDFEHPADAKAEEIYARLRTDARMSAIIGDLKKRELSDFEIRVVFRHASMIPGRWELDKEAPAIAMKRRSEMSRRLQALLPDIEADPDLARLHFGTSAISSGSLEREPGMFSLADCVRVGILELNGMNWAKEKMGIEPDAPEREIGLKRYAILQISSILEREGRRSANKITAGIVSIILGEDVSANDVTQARKYVRRRYHRDQ